MITLVTRRRVISGRTRPDARLDRRNHRPVRIGTGDGIRQ